MIFHLHFVLFYSILSVCPESFFLLLLTLPHFPFKKVKDNPFQLSFIPL